MNQPQPLELDSLRDIVQTNCHISDARHAGDYTLCVYLLKMREFYRWEKGVEFGEPLANDAVGDWLTERERYWESLETADFNPLHLNGDSFDPFHSDAINASLLPAGLVYSAGYGAKFKPLFFLAELEKTLDEDGFRVHIAARELARDLTAPPAMSQGRNIFVRRESLRRMVWEKLEEWRWNRLDNAMGRAIACYDFDADLQGALDRMTDNEIETLVLHEIGEVRAGARLDPAWNAMLQRFPRCRVELMIRAVRDHLADALSTLPTLLDRSQPASLHFYFANLNGMRKSLYPALIDAYDQWVATGDTAPLLRQAEDGGKHWLALAEEILAHHRAQADEAGRTTIETLIDAGRL
jgi:hypothetical protein